MVLLNTVNGDARQPGSAESTAKVANRSLDGILGRLQIVPDILPERIDRNVVAGPTVQAVQKAELDRVAQ
jgi:hypothetical protein